MAGSSIYQSNALQKTADLCHLCHQFTTDLSRFDYIQQDTYTAPWVKGTRLENGDFFRHHESFASLSGSADECRMCYVLLDIFKPMDESKRQGWLGLYPWCPQVHGHSRRTIAAAFGEKPREISLAGRLGLKGSPHLLKICTRHQWDHNKAFRDRYPLLDDPTGLFRAIPESSSSPDAFDTARAWLRDCVRDHEECRKAGEHPLPTRVIDVGTSEADMPTIYCSTKVTAPYAVLSHCWGGDIPGKTMKHNAASRQNGLPLGEIPQNFRDAIKITRELGMRYVWIDALCIIQDCVDDWRREAANMASIYARATIMISALDAVSSTVGILKPERAPLAILSQGSAVQRMLPTLAEALSTCPLNSRGWCLQERLLAPRVIHFGRHQMFWECCVHHFGEDGRLNQDGGTWDDRAGQLITLRKDVLNKSRTEWELWLQIVEEYTGRLFTQPSDKLPALAGAALAFRDIKGEGHYVAGMWEENIGRGLHWRAHYNHAIGRKVPGPNTLDKCAVLTKPPEKRAPSWSWASLDGRIEFARAWAPLIHIDVEMTVGYDDRLETRPQGRLRIRGLMAEAFYHQPVVGGDVGVLRVSDGNGNPKVSSPDNEYCLLDLDRSESRNCWILVTNATDTYPTSFLVLSEREDGCFTRIGCHVGASFHGQDIYRAWFKERTIVLV